MIEAIVLVVIVVALVIYRKGPHSTSFGNAPMPKLAIYILGLVPLAYFYERLKAGVNDLIFVIVAIAYLVIIRLVAEKYGK